MLRLTYDPVFGVTVLYASGLELAAPFDRIGVAPQEPLLVVNGPANASVITRTVEAGGQGNYAAEGDPHSGD